jgi:hypothetical protein
MYGMGINEIKLYRNRNLLKTERKIWAKFLWFLASCVIRHIIQKASIEELFRLNKRKFFLDEYREEKS